MKLSSSGKDYSTLTDALIKLLRDMTSEEARHTLNPGGLFSHICSKVPRFKGYQQQDSHELLRYLLDAMKNEEQKVSYADCSLSFTRSDS